jgi:hypothetical protein
MFTASLIAGARAHRNAYPMRLLPSCQALGRTRAVGPPDPCTPSSCVGPSSGQRRPDDSPRCTLPWPPPCLRASLTSCADWATGRGFEAPRRQMVARNPGPSTPAFGLRSGRTVIRNVPPACARVGNLLVLRANGGGKSVRAERSGRRPRSRSAMSRDGRSQSGPSTPAFGLRSGRTVVGNPFLRPALGANGGGKSVRADASSKPTCSGTTWCRIGPFAR